MTGGDWWENVEPPARGPLMLVFGCGRPLPRACGLGRRCGVGVVCVCVCARLHIGAAIGVSVCWTAWRGGPLPRTLPARDRTPPCAALAGCVPRCIAPPTVRLRSGVGVGGGAACKVHRVAVFVCAGAPNACMCGQPNARACSFKNEIKLLVHQLDARMIMPLQGNLINDVHVPTREIRWIRYAVRPQPWLSWLTGASHMWRATQVPPFRLLCGPRKSQLVTKSRGGGEVRGETETPAISCCRGTTETGRGARLPYLCTQAPAWARPALQFGSTVWH